MSLPFWYEGFLLYVINYSILNYYFFNLTGIDVEALKAENVQLKEENGELKQAIEALNAKLDALTADAE